eukprot:TRINITY_DN106093_c0_g1_i1.p1 TRINITY_DN106093_c0_g1~~TRINITY_DN106093_c0_g1_i1.p1  ORF type:complete len:830 (-),score=150.35 TRINITY_DN106093_c0_g1_i1:79-2568(-)
MVNMLFFLPTVPVLQMIIGLAVNLTYFVLVFRNNIYITTPRKIWKNIVVDVINVAERSSALICVLVHVASFIHYFKYEYEFLEIFGYMIDASVMLSTALFLLLAILLLRREVSREFVDCNMRACGDDLLAEIVRATCAIWKASEKEDYLLCSIICSQLEKLRTRAVQELGSGISTLSGTQDVKELLQKECSDHPGLLSRATNRAWSLCDLLRFGERNVTNSLSMGRNPEVGRILNSSHDQHSEDLQQKIAKLQKGLKIAMGVIWDKWKASKGTIEGRGLYELWSEDYRAMFELLVQLRNEASMKEHYNAAIYVQSVIRQAEVEVGLSFSIAAREMGQKILRKFENPIHTSFTFKNCYTIQQQLQQHNKMVLNGLSELLSAIIRSGKHSKEMRVAIIKEYNAHSEYLRTSTSPPGLLKIVLDTLPRMRTITRTLKKSERKSILNDINGCKSFTKHAISMEKRKQRFGFAADALMSSALVTNSNGNNNHSGKSDDFSRYETDVLYSKLQTISDRMSTALENQQQKQYGKSDNLIDSGTTMRMLIKLMHDKRIRSINRRRKARKIFFSLILILLCLSGIIFSVSSMTPEPIPPAITTGDCVLSETVLPTKCRPDSNPNSDAEFPHNSTYIYKSHPQIEWSKYGEALDFLRTFFALVIDQALEVSRSMINSFKCVQFAENMMCSWLYPPCTESCEHTGKCLGPCANLYSRCFMEIDVTGSIEQFLPDGEYYGRVKDLLPDEEVRVLVMEFIESAIRGCINEDIVKLEEPRNSQCASEELYTYVTDTCSMRSTNTQLEEYIEENVTEFSCPLKESTYLSCPSASTESSSSSSTR